MVYLQDDTIPNEEKSDKAFKMRVSRFVIVQGKLYKKIHGKYISKMFGRSRSYKIYEKYT